MITRDLFSRSRSFAASTLEILLVLGTILCGSIARAQNSPVSVNVDAQANRHAINPNIYGIAYGTPSVLSDLNAPLNRQGGDPTTRYNWQLNADNRAFDYYFESIGDSSAVAGYRGDSFISDSKSAGAQAMLTIPMIDWVAKLGPNRNTLASFSIAKYGAQTDHDPYFTDAGNGILTNGNNVTGNNPNDANVPSSVTFQQGWVQHLLSTWGPASSGGLRYYLLDNEPSIWFSVHRDVEPTGLTMAQMAAKMINYSAMIKSVDPTALVLGPEEWGWDGYLYSGYDQQYAPLHNYSSFPDRAANGNVDYVAYLLTQMYQYQVAHGTRLLDIFSLHFYPQGGEFSDDVTTATQLLRNRSTRSLWDPNYVNESWINTQVDLIPRMKAWVTSYYPGTPVALTEYNWGAEGSINGATTQADIFGIFGSQALDMATRWTYPDSSTPTYKAMKMYRNYDGNKSTFGDTSVSATTADVDNLSSFAAVRTSDGALTVMVINKVLSGSTPVTVNLANFTPGSTAQVWQLTSANAITQLASVAASASMTLTVPAQSITLLVIPATTTTPVYRIHAGPGTIGAFNPDQYYNGGSLFTVSQNVDTSAPNAAPMAVYQTQRYGNFSYVFPSLTPGAAYTVRLHFAETYFTTLGQRFFNVTINGVAALTNFDPATAAGAVNKAVVEQFTTTADSTGKITITLAEVSNWPLINGVEIIAGAGNNAPSAPTNLAAVAGNAQVGLTWIASAGATTYNVKRSLTSGGPYTNIAGGVTTTSYTDTGLTNGTPYYYVVSALNTSGESANSTQVSATPSAQTAVYRIHAGPGTIGTFNPDNYYNGGSLFTVSQSVDTSAPNAAPMAVYQTQRFGNFSYIMPSLTPGAAYTVRLHFAETYFTTLGQRFFNVTINGVAALTNFDPATAAGAVNKAIVETFTAAADANGKITITLTEVSNWPLINGVEIISGAGNTIPSPPTNLAATPGNAQVGLTWTASAGATSYKVYRSLTSGSGYAVAGAPTTTSYTDTGLTNGTTYYYVVTAVNTLGESGYSSQVAATPSAVTAAYRIHAGPGTIGVFNPDAYYNGGSLYSVSQTVNTSGVANAAPMAVYQTQRFGNFSYIMPSLTPGASYTVRLHFAETYFTTLGQRFFNVTINGVAALTNFDIATAAGAVNKALVEQFTAVADANGNITITFAEVSNWPLINGVEILH